MLLRLFPQTHLGLHKLHKVLQGLQRCRRGGRNLLLHSAQALLHKGPLLAAHRGQGAEVQGTSPDVRQTGACH